MLSGLDLLAYARLQRLYCKLLCVEQLDLVAIAEFLFFSSSDLHISSKVD